MTSTSNTELLGRVQTGNDKLYSTWRAACEALDTDPTEYDRLMGMIDRAWPKLDRLCLDLEVSGFEGCLYDIPHCKTGAREFCYVCLSKISHWRQVKQGELIKEGAAK